MLQRQELAVIGDLPSTGGSCNCRQITCKQQVTSQLAINQYFFTFRLCNVLKWITVNGETSNTVL